LGSWKQKKSAPRLGQNEAVPAFVLPLTFDAASVEGGESTLLRLKSSDFIHPFGGF
jgi:hypothetical protein